MINVQQVLPKLTFLDLSNSTSLTKSPEFSGFPNLEHLALEGCTALLEINPSIKYLKKLKHLNLEGCYSLRALPYGIESQCLDVLNFSGCLKLVNILECFGDLKQLLHLNLEETSVTELPKSIGNCTDLLQLDCTDCRKLRSVPSSIGKLRKLEMLSLEGCFSLTELPEELGLINSLLTLKVLDSGVREFPPSVVRLKNLSKLYFQAFFIGRSPSASRISNATPLNFLGFLYLTWLDLELFGLTSISLCYSLKQLWLGGDFERLPVGIKDFRNLDFLMLRGCMCLTELPELPPSVTNVLTGGCESLRTIFTASVLRNARALSFTGCPKLVGSEEIKTILGFKFLYDQIQENMNQRRRFYAGPGSKVPEWNRYQNGGYSLKFQLPAIEDLNISKLLGFAFSAVVATKHHSCYLRVRMIIGGKFLNFFVSYQGSRFPGYSKNVVIVFFPMECFADVDLIHERKDF